MNKRTEKVQTLIKCLKKIFESASDGEAIGFDDLKKRLPAEVSDDTTEKKLQYALRVWRDELLMGSATTTLTINKNSASFAVKDETIFDQNMRHHLPQKRAIAAILWHWLFDFSAPKGTEYSTNLQEERLKKRIDHKLNIFRNRVNPAIVVDAGSTNTIAVEHFLSSAGRVPFLITHRRRLIPAHEHETDDGKKKEAKDKRKTEALVEYKRLVAPLFVTNSITIADRIANSRFRQSIHLRVIGGTDSPERRYICGELALLWLRACDQDGKMVALDLAIIGSTGIETSRFDTPVLCCDSVDESSLKSRLLAMSRFRIALIDSEKLKSGGTNSMFAAVSEGDLDLIFTDSGMDREAQLAVERLSYRCSKNGVGLIIAHLGGN